MALSMRKWIYNHTGKWPHLVINKIHNSKLGLSSSLHKGTTMNPKTMKAYQTYHAFLTLAVEQVKHNGLLLVPIPSNQYKNYDLDAKKTVLKYGISNTEINTKNFSSPYITICHFAKVTGIPLDELIVGKYSLGAHLERFFIHAIPSNSIDMSRGIRFEQYTEGYKFKNRYHLYFRYTFKKNMSAIQIRIPHFFTTTLMREYYADLFARALKDFLQQEYTSEDVEHTEETETSVVNTTMLMNITVHAASFTNLSRFSWHYYFLLVISLFCIF